MISRSTLLLLLFSICSVSCLSVHNDHPYQYVNEWPSDFSSFETNIHQRFRRSAETNSNVTSKANHLNATQQQLIVHWVGEGSPVIICLAKDLKDSNLRVRPRLPSSVYYSYDYGDTFQDKSHLFRLNKANGTVASLDKFFIHDKFQGRIIFTDSTNKAIFVTEDNGVTVSGYNVSFVPSAISLHPTQPKVFLAHDLVDSARTLYVTRDFGKTWTLLQMYVKSFDWFSDTDSEEKDLIVQRMEPDGFSMILKLTAFLSDLHTVATGLLPEVNAMYIKGQFMFATKNITTTNNTVVGLNLYVKYKAGPFILATFATDLPRYEFQIADITENRLLIAVAHSNTLCNLYVSDFVFEETENIHFFLSLERAFCYFPNITWKDSLITGLSETPFLDLHKVEGLRGIYIASQVHPSLGNHSSITLEHLTTKITFSWGARWQKLNLINPLITPKSCENKTNNCSLHLTQKMALWYPSARNMPILSSKSAPGIIIATGIYDQSMKGHPAVFMSRDAGVTWRHVLSDSYFFNMGDHGSIIVAAPFTKSKDGSTNITYSLDEGETWQTRQISEQPLRIYSLMTEPGENTTIFSLYGSYPGAHKWLIVKIDFTNVFARNCTNEDYKPWTPFDPEDKKLSCVLGRRDVFKRRINRPNCYNGLNFDAPISKENCECDNFDYMCDNGFNWDDHTESCIRNKNSSIDHYAIPKKCPPFTTYNRTRGYRKIPGDTCVIGLIPEPIDILPCPIDGKKEFLLLAQKERIVMFKLSDFTSEILPIEGLQNVISVEFDYHENCLFYADIVSDVISKVCLSKGNGSVPVVDSRLHSVEGMAYDWVSKHLYFVDGVLGRIEVVRTDVDDPNRFRKTVINNTIARKPRGIAIHPSEGYMFWTDWVSGNPSVNRANLDGSDPVKLFSKTTVEWPNGITIDYIARRIYWVDAREDYIASSNFFGKGFKKIIDQNSKVSHPFSVAVFKDKMYWDDWRSNAIFSADKDHGTGIQVVASALPGLMDLKIYAHSSQEGTNACANNTKCSHLCFGLPDNKYSCQCPDDLTLVNGTTCVCPGGVKLLKNGTCPSVQNTCSINFFSCSNGNCLPLTLKCDGDNDCGDGSDELNCGNKTNHCNPHFFRCGDGKCIPSYWRCDYDNDCADLSDEKDCPYPTCKSDQFSCDNGRCIAMKWRCDSDNDCRDGSDERNCTQTPTTRTCQPDEFACGLKSFCIPSRWKCDNEKDCPDGTDEDNCKDTSCENWQFPCENHKCIYAAWKCDGDNDCGDGSDEKDCSTVTPATIPDVTIAATNSCVNWMYQCNNRRCIPYWWKCDRINDCGDNSDEVGCIYTPSSTVPTSPTTTSASGCGTGEFQCALNECIPYSWVCDGMEDCNQGEDEKDCGTFTPSYCPLSEFRCRRSGICIPLTQRCDGVSHCADGSDEEFCMNSNRTTPIPFKRCSGAEFLCDLIHCHLLHEKCDGDMDCYDATDEENCISPSNKTYQATSLIPDRITQDSFHFTWIVLPSVLANDTSLQFIPSIFANKTWRNESATSFQFYSFRNLSPATTYSVVVYVQNRTSGQIYPPGYNVSITTNIGKPSPPRNVEVQLINSTAIEIKWSPPAEPNGPLAVYLVSLSPPLPPVTKTVLASQTSAIIKFPFEDRRYTLWVIAKNALYQSDASMTSHIIFKTDNRIAVANLTAYDVTSYTVTLKWQSTLSDTTFKISCPIKRGYPAIKPKFTKETTYLVENLSPGVDYLFEVNPLNSDNLNSVASVMVTTKGTPFPRVRGLKIAAEDDAAVLEWDPMPGNRKFNFAVFYGMFLNEMFEAPKNISNETRYKVQNLNRCSSYMFDVAVEFSGSYGPLSDSPKSMVTNIDPQAPPRDVKASLDGPVLIKIKWRSSCDFTNLPIAYRVNIYEIVSKQQFGFDVPETTERSLMRTFNGSLGGHYTISVITKADGAIESAFVDIKTAPIPPPVEVIIYKMKNRGFTVKWDTDKSSKMYNLTGKYEIVVCKGNHIDLSRATIYKSDTSPYNIHHLPHDQIHTIAVRFVTETGLTSELSSGILYNFIEEIPGEAVKEAEQSSGYKWPIVLILSLICAVTGFAYWKRKRSQMNFKNLANSHYNTRSGSTTFSGVNGLDLEDAPEHREHFSDDEPLVIA
ncbi:hypothetical protein V9T40_003207 [Parthenolecanium corni]|uniref:Sortilin-related receptor n=1 Tax=Parthenolecanium corni TaxID=536013 RepID=A0AAN9TSB2_9HEMI